MIGQIEYVEYIWTPDDELNKSVVARGGKQR